MKRKDSQKLTSQSSQKDTYKVQLNFSGKSIADIDELKEITAASARAEVIRNALRWMFWCAEQVSQGGTFLIEREGRQREIVFPFVRRGASHMHTT